MNDMSMMVQGNLALKYEKPARRRSSHASFTVVEGFGTPSKPIEAPAKATSGPKRSIASQPAYSHKTIALFIGSVAIAIAIVAAIFGVRSEAYADIARHTPMHTVSVSAGDTLWDLAEEHPVDGLSTYETVKLIESQNHLSSSELSLGQSLKVPDSTFLG